MNGYNTNNSTSGELVLLERSTRYRRVKTPIELLTTDLIPVFAGKKTMIRCNLRICL